MQINKLRQEIEYWENECCGFEDKEIDNKVNSFIGEWCESKAHLLDNDENDGQELKVWIYIQILKAKLQGYELATEELEKMMPNANNTNPCMKCGSVQCARCGFDLLNEFDKLKSKIKGDGRLGNEINKLGGSVQ